MAEGVFVALIEGGAEEADFGDAVFTGGDVAPEGIGNVRVFAAGEEIVVVRPGLSADGFRCLHGYTFGLRIQVVLVCRDRRRRTLRRSSA